MLVGKIVHLVKDKGYGFIQSNEYDTSIFFHAKNLKGAVTFADLNVGDDVEFAPVVTSNKGDATQEVKVI